MEHQNSTNAQNTNTDEMKQAFLASAISDMATWIQLSDTKVSIIMGALVALIAGGFACYEPINQALLSIRPCSWIGVSLNIFILILCISTICVFVFGILTIRGHASVIDYKSKWFFAKTTKEYSFDAYKQDLKMMTGDDIIENMCAELYKLNDINRQKSKSMKWVIRSFATSLVVVSIISVLLLINTL